MALTMSRSSDISTAQPELGAGGVEPPDWFTLRKQPLSVVHAGRPYTERYVARSLAAFGSSKASTMATVRPEPAVADVRL